MTPEMKKELQHFLSCAERLQADLAGKVELAKYMLAEAENSVWMPTFPASVPAGLLDVQASMAVLNFVQSNESMAKTRAANPQHPMPKKA